MYSPVSYFYGFRLIQVESFEVVHYDSLSLLAWKLHAGNNQQFVYYNNWLA